MSLADWSPIATRALSQGRAAFWLKSSPATFRVTCYDGIHNPIYWTGSDWSGSSADAIEFTHREDAELELRSARRSTHETRREFVAVEES